MRGDGATLLQVVVRRYRERPTPAVAQVPQRRSTPVSIVKAASREKQDLLFSVGKTYKRLFPQRRMIDHSNTSIYMRINGLQLHPRLGTNIKVL